MMYVGYIMESGNISCRVFRVPDRNPFPSIINSDCYSVFPRREKANVLD